MRHVISEHLYIISTRNDLQVQRQLNTRIFRGEELSLYHTTKSTEKVKIHFYDVIFGKFPPQRIFSLDMNVHLSLSSSFLAVQNQRCAYSVSVAICPVNFEITKRRTIQPHNDNYKLLQTASNITGKQTA